MAKPKRPITARDRRRWGRKGGKLGGRLRAASLSPARRSEIARIAISARWAKQRAQEVAKEKADGAAGAVPRETEPQAQ